MEILSGPGSSIASAICLFAVTAAIRIAAPSIALWSQAEKPAAPTPQQVEFFETNIRPVLIDTCGECHTDKEDGELRTDSRAGLLEGGRNGPQIVPSEPE